MLNRKAKLMDIKSFFDLEKVVFSNEELEAPYENEPTDVIFIKENNSSKSKPANVIFSRNNRH